MGGARLATAISSPLGGQVGLVQRCPAPKPASPAAQNTPELPIDIIPQPCQYRRVRGGLEKQFFLTRAALDTCGAQKANSYQSITRIAIYCYSGIVEA
jgi:hypothetical protein